jgi:hypothetical protein
VVFFTNKTDHHDITEILLKVAYDRDFDEVDNDLCSLSTAGESFDPDIDLLSDFVDTASSDLDIGIFP